MKALRRSRVSKSTSSVLEWEIFWPPDGITYSTSTEAPGTGPATDAAMVMAISASGEKSHPTTTRNAFCSWVMAVFLSARGSRVRSVAEIVAGNAQKIGLGDDADQLLVVTQDRHAADLVLEEEVDRAPRRVAGAHGVHA